MFERQWLPLSNLETLYVSAVTSLTLAGLMVVLLSARTLGAEAGIPRISVHLQMHWSLKSSFLSILLWIRQIATCVRFKCILFWTSQLQVWVVFLCWWPWFYLALPFWQQKCRNVFLNSVDELVASSSKFVIALVLALLHNRNDVRVFMVLEYITVLC